MRCYNKIKRVLEKNKDVVVTKEGNRIIIMKKDKILTSYDLRFVEYSNTNLKNFLEHWQYKLDGRRKLDLDEIVEENMV